MTTLSGLKKCLKCGLEKERSEFHRDKTRKDGLREWCKQCTKIKNAEYWKRYSSRHEKRNREYKYKHKDTIYRIARKYRESHRGLMLWLSAKKRATKQNVPFNIEVEDIVIPDTCPLLGIKLEFNGSVNNRDSSPSLDRKNPALGYVKGNIAVISYRANRIKNNASAAEIKLLAVRIDSYVS